MEDRNRTRIIQAARELLNNRGYRSITIDDIANALGISKKTIYQVFSSKEEIAEAVLGEMTGSIAARVEEIKGSGLDPVTKLRQIIAVVKEMRAQINPVFLEDLQKYAPNLWNRMEKQREERTMLMEELLREGQEAGLIKNVNPRLAVLMYLSVVKNLIRPDLIIQHGFSIEEIFDALSEVFIGGLSTAGRNEPPRDG